MAERRTIAVHDDTFEQIYAIKGPRRSMEDAIKDLLNAVYPPAKDDDGQKKLTRCPACGEYTITIDEDGGYYCTNRLCEYEPEEGEL